MHTEYWIWGILIFLIIGYGLFLLIRSRLEAYYKQVPQTHIWTAIRWQGGGQIQTPEPLTEAQALLWAASLGSVGFVDRQYHFIFYRPHGH